MPSRRQIQNHQQEASSTDRRHNGKTSSSTPNFLAQRFSKQKYSRKNQAQNPKFSPDIQITRLSYPDDCFLKISPQNSWDLQKITAYWKDDNCDSPGGGSNPFKSSFKCELLENTFEGERYPSELDEPKVYRKKK